MFALMQKAMLWRLRVGSKGPVLKARPNDSRGQVADFKPSGTALTKDGSYMVPTMISENCAQHIACGTFSLAVSWFSNNVHQPSFAVAMRRKGSRFRLLTVSEPRGQKGKSMSLDKAIEGYTDACRVAASHVSALAFVAGHVFLGRQGADGRSAPYFWADCRVATPEGALHNTLHWVKYHDPPLGREPA